jgi:hypothetical protein
VSEIGGCLCGQVRYNISGRIGGLVYCHCKQCRKAQGSIFAANIPVLQKHFSLTSGSEVITSFRSSANKSRYFCPTCGSGIYSYLDGASSLRIRAGTLDDAPSLRLSAHIYINSKVHWLRLADGIPQFIEKEPREA